MTIAKVDATANDVPDEIAGFPTIKLYAAGKKGSPIDYSGGRTVEEIAAFIRDNGTNKIDVTGDIVDEASSEAAEGTEEMQHQAPAATKGTAEKIKEKVEEVVDAATGGGDDVDDHDEL